jgi:hypothetical protein
MQSIFTDGTGTLCGFSAEWILEDLGTLEGFAPLPIFPSGIFFNATSTASNGEVVIPANANLFDMVQNGTTVCAGQFDAVNQLVEYIRTA